METVTLEARVFLDRYSPRTIRIAKGSSPALIGNPRIHKFIERLHRDFETVKDKPGSRPPLPGEDVFWWCVGILEELPYVRRNAFHGPAAGRPAPDPCPKRSSQTCA